VIAFPAALLNYHPFKALDRTRYPILATDLLPKLLSALSHGDILHCLFDGPR
jgi:hypothetical protein